MPNAIERLRKWGPGDYTRDWNRKSADQFDADLAAVDALYQAAKALRYSPDANGGDVLVARNDFYALAAAVRRVEGK